MRSKEEIENTLKEHKTIRDLIKPGSGDEEAFAFVFQDGFIKALEWVLEIE